ncbi:hypothetical protein [uncultured Paraglaciecola sp.]|uniref:hypothetical protein n=1 Tax=uncultured Paraglaciecola sp. TaxID=1765024 RepID=UPI002618B627|nr:hypothetical protein [uncultured Paraglaciecola sp.]
MNTKPKSLFTLAGVTLTALAFFNMSQTLFVDVNSYCSHIENLELAQGLPVSHPANRCASQQTQEISWSEWFAGGSSSYQFHFIDLLELLSRTGNNEVIHPANPVNSN